MRLLVAALVVLVVGCGEDPEGAIINSWEGASLEQDYRFYPDGRAELMNRDHRTCRGICSFSNPGEMNCRLERLADLVVRSVRARSNNSS